MYNPPHPGEIIKEDVLVTEGINVTEAARQLGISRVTLSRLSNSKTGNLGKNLLASIVLYRVSNNPAVREDQETKDFPGQEEFQHLALVNTV